MAKRLKRDWNCWAWQYEDCSFFWRTDYGRGIGGKRTPEPLGIKGRWVRVKFVELKPTRKAGGR